MVIAMYDLSKAFTAPSVRTKPVFFIVEYSSMLFILRYLYMVVSVVAEMIKIMIVMVLQACMLLISNE